MTRRARRARRARGARKARRVTRVRRWFSRNKKKQTKHMRQRGRLSATQKEAPAATWGDDDDVLFVVAHEIK